MADYDTKLTPEEKSVYDHFFSENDSTDYDMQGYFKDSLDKNGSFNKNSEGQHYPDTFKKPNHITFSNESKYSGKDGNEGGSWEKMDNGSFAFFPGSTNLQSHSTGDMIDYFAQYEKGNSLVLPGY